MSDPLILQNAVDDIFEKINALHLLCPSCWNVISAVECTGQSTVDSTGCICVIAQINNANRAVSEIWGRKERPERGFDAVDHIARALNLIFRFSAPIHK